MSKQNKPRLLIMLQFLKFKNFKDHFNNGTGYNITFPKLYLKKKEKQTGKNTSQEDNKF